MNIATRILLMAGTGVLILSSGSVFAEKVAEDTRVEHYEAKPVADSAEALELMKEDVKTILEIVSAEDVTKNMEQVHEMSYTLEVAVDKLKEEKIYDAEKLQNVDEAVQAIHYGSEAGEVEEVKQWASKLDTQVNALEATEEKAAALPKNTYEIIIKDHKFTPEEIHAPAGEKITLIVDNQDPTPEEFESDDFRREKIIAGNSKATIIAGPLEPGKYHFFGEFNLDTANGYLIVE